VASTKGVTEFQFVIRFRKEPRAPERGREIWRGKILLVPKRTGAIPEREWSQRWVESIDEVPDAIRALLAGVGDSAEASAVSNKH